MSNELKDCPFCGCKMAVRSNRDWHRPEGDHADTCPVYDSDLMYPATDHGMRALLSVWNNQKALAAPASGAALSGAREKFEAWAKEVFPDLNQMRESGYPDEYACAQLHAAWHGWQGAIAHQPPKEALTKTDLWNLIEAYVDASQDHHDSITVDDGRKCRAAMLDAQNALAEAIEAATGPNKALVEALKQVFVNTREKKVRDYIRAALSAAGVTLKGE